MEKIKRLRELFDNLSLRKSIACYIIFFVLAALMLGSITEGVCSAAAGKIQEKYYDYAERYYLTNEKGERLGEGTYIWKTEYPRTEKDERLLRILDIIPMVGYPLYSGLCVMAAAVLFYRNKLKRPLQLLTEAYGKISRNDLDFSLCYENRDEMGQLCRSFEIMRGKLEENYIGMWRTMEERKRLNAAFAHDLRTPLTVLKGYNEMLLLSEEARVQGAAATMGKHISRMERYVDSMSRMRRLEDREPEYGTVELASWLAALRQGMEVFCAEKERKLEFRQEVGSQKMLLDTGLIQEVADNLLSNAARFAKQKIRVTVSEQRDGLILTVEDDGEGFSPQALEKALEPYYHEEKSGGGEDTRKGKAGEAGECSARGETGEGGECSARGEAGEVGGCIVRGEAGEGGEDAWRGEIDEGGETAGRVETGEVSERTVRGKSHGDGEHLGLGLYICRVLCRCHGGSLHIQNTARGGQATAFFKSN